MDAWNLPSARAVAGPKYEVSLFGEPAPERDTWKPCLFRKIWRYLTSEPVAPIVIERVKAGMEPEVVGVVVTADPPASEALVIGPIVPVCDIP